MLLALGWRSLTPRFPEDLRKPDALLGEVIWPAGEGGPYHRIGELQEAEVVVLGSSRVHNGIFLRDLAKGGLESVACLWGGNAQVGELLAELRLRVSPRRVLLALDPLVVYTPRSEDQVELLRLKPDLGGSEDLPELERWTQEVTDYLLESGHDRVLVTRFVAEWYAKQAAYWERQRWTSDNVDRWLGDWANGVRGDVVRPVETRSWRRSWFPPIDEHKSDAEYAGWLKAHTSAPRAEAFGRLEDELSAMVADGWDIACIRFPVAPSIFALEQTALTQSDLHDFCRRLGLPYFDHGSDTRFKTADGTHMTHSGGSRFSRELAEEVVAELGW